MIIGRVMTSVFMVLVASTGNSQIVSKASDTSIIRKLPDITVVGKNSKSDYQLMPEIVGTNIYAGKKNTLIVLENVQGNVANNTMRQILAKVPGIHVWESDPSGIQIGVSARGLSPNRSWEFNVRQNGYDIAADPFGYPEAYYNPQLQAVQRIEVVRGHGALQYGPQFGGLMNYILRNGSEINKAYQFERQQTTGSNGLLNRYSAFGGTKGKFHYYTFYDHRRGDGWRENSRFYTNAGYGTVTYNMSHRFSITAEVMQSHFRSQQPGGLTDMQFKEDARQSLRSRNWFDIVWTTPALIANYHINEHTTWNTKAYGTIGNRNSVGFLHTITSRDSINPVTLNYNNRTLQIDQYRNAGIESRIITDYNIGRIQTSISGGIRLYRGTTRRLADGKGTIGSTYDMTLLGNYPKNIHFTSQNMAAFLENIFRINEKLSIIPGVRYEWLTGSAKGRNGYDSNGKEISLQNMQRKRSFVIAGLGAEYHITSSTELYGNISQAYRPIQFANLQAPPTTDMVDPNLRDANGYNADLGYRGKVKNYLQFDISGYYLQYNNRIGTITPQGSTYRLITNIGSSTSKGFEGFMEFSPIHAFKKNQQFTLLLFCSYGYTNARYSTHHKDANTKGKKVENAPEHIIRGGITGGYKKFQLTTQFSSVGKTFSDANNTYIPSTNGNTGLIPSYKIMDITASYIFSKAINIKAGINNLSNKMYFTRRSAGYPGPGILPADGRTFFVTISSKF